MNSAVIHGVRLEVRAIKGSSARSPLVFLHEGLGSVSMWQQRGRDWPGELCQATGRAGWVYSRRGYGRSQPVEDVRGVPRMNGFWHVGQHEPDYMHREAMEVLPAILQQLGVQNPVLVGHSDGATIALLHASQHSVSACVAMAPHVFVEDVSLRSITQARNAYADGGGNGLRTRLERYHDDVDNAFWQWNDIWLNPAFRSFDIRQACPKVTAPLLVIQGENDEYGTLQQVTDILESVPQARSLVLPDCGHSPHRDCPDTVIQALDKFLADCP